MKNTALSLAFAAGSALASAPAAGSGWNKVQMLDDFTGGAGSAPSSSNWIVQTGTSYPGGAPAWGTWEVETYTSSAANIQQAGNGNLMITPIKSSSGAWTSGRLESKRNDFKAPAGGKLRIEARIQMPNVTGSNGLGYWPAFWTIGGAFRGNYTNWPMVGELDIMENVNGIDTTSSVMHCDKNPGGVCNEPNGLGQTASCTGSRCPGNFHIYEMVIDRSVKPEQIKFWLDRSLRHTITADQVGATVWSQINQGLYIVLNVAMGGAYPNALAGTTTPTSSTVSGKSMLVDYVAVWTTS